MKKKTETKIIKMNAKQCDKEIARCMKEGIGFEIKLNDCRIFYLVREGEKRGILGKFVGSKTFIFQSGRWVDIT